MGHLQVDAKMDAGQEGFRTAKTKTIATKDNSSAKKRASVSSTRLDQYEYPKHSLYGREKYTLSTRGPFAADESTTVAVTLSIPIHGRSPKGSKVTELVYWTFLITNDDETQESANAQQIRQSETTNGQSFSNWHCIFLDSRLLLFFSEIVIYFHQPHCKSI